MRAVAALQCGGAGLHRNGGGVVNAMRCKRSPAIVKKA